MSYSTNGDKPDGDAPKTQWERHVEGCCSCSFFEGLHKKESSTAWYSEVYVRLAHGFEAGYLEGVEDLISFLKAMKTGKTLEFILQSHGNGNKPVPEISANLLHVLQYYSNGNKPVYEPVPEGTEVNVQS